MKPSQSVKAQRQSCATPMRRRAAWARLASIALLSALLCLGATTVQAQTASVRFDPADGQVDVGQELQIDIWVENVDDLFGVDLRFSYDPALVDIVDADSSKAGIQIEAGTHPYPDFVVKNLVDESDATVWYAATQLRPREPATGSGRIARVTIRGRAAGTGSFDVINARLVTSGALEVSAESAGGEVSVLSAPEDTSVQPTSTRTRTPTAAPTLTPNPASPTVGATAPPGPTRLPDYPDPVVEPSRTPDVQAPLQTAIPTQAYPESGPTASSQAISQGQTEVALLTPGPAGLTAATSMAMPASVLPGSDAQPEPTGRYAMPAQPAPAVALALPTLEGLPRPQRAAASPEPLISKRIFACGVVLLVLVSLLLGLYLIRLERGRGSGAT